MLHTRPLGVALSCLVLAGCPEPQVVEADDAADDDAAADDDVVWDDDSLNDDEGDCGDGHLDDSEDCDEGEANGTTPCGCNLNCNYPHATSSCDDGDPCTADDYCDGEGGCTGGGPLDCDDEDACTVDSCEVGTGECLHEPLSFTGPLDQWDIALLSDPSTLDVSLEGTQTVWEGILPIEVQEIRYTSYESEGCELLPIRIEAYVAYPVGASSMTPAPGLVVAHGLGGWAEAGSASGPAAELGAVTLAYSGPGQGASEGWGSEPDHLFDTVDAPRDSWFWEHAAAAMRGLTVLETLAEVDASRLGMTGYSGGAVATLMVNGVDSRVTTVVPVSASGHLDLAIEATPVPGWEYDLLQGMNPPRDASDDEWLQYVAYLDPANYLATAHGDVLLVNGAQDEFFPIHSLQATFADLQATGGDHRLLAIKDWDHGWFALFNGDEAAELSGAALRYWFGRGFGTDAAYAELVPMPRVDAVIPWICWWELVPFNCSAVQASLDTSTGYTVESVRFHHSVDGSLTYFSADLDESGGVWLGEAPYLDGTIYDANDTVWFVEFTLRADLLGLETFTVTSEPNIPAGFSPNILPIAGPLP